MPFTDVFPRNAPYSSGRATLLSDGNGLIEAIARGGPRGNAGTLDSNVEFDHTEVLASTVPIQHLVYAVRPRSRPTANAIFDQGFGLFSEAASEDIRSWLRDHVPHASDILDRILGAEPQWISESDAGLHYRIETDAVNVALEIAGLDRDEALSNYPVPETPEHFTLDTLPTLNEHAILIDDLDYFPGWTYIEPLRPTGRVFEDTATGRTLYVLHANNNSIEHTSGADLLYFVHEYNSLVIVQYKLVRQTSDSQGRKTMQLRIDDRLDAQEIRLAWLEAQSHTRLSVYANSLNDYRLANSLGFFKLCEVDQPREVSDLSRGKYVDLATWKLMADSKLMRGERGGRRLLYDDVVRYFDNSTFAALVSEGWIGSRTTDLEALVDFITYQYEGGKSLIFGSLKLGRTFRRPRRTSSLSSRPIHVA